MRASIARPPPLTPPHKWEGDQVALSNSLPLVGRDDSGASPSGVGVLQ